MKLKLSIFALLLTGIMSGCSVAKSLYVPTEANAKLAGTSVQDLINGKVLYMNKCNQCHGLKKPGKYSATVWEGYIDDMQERAKITDNEKALIYAYLTSEIAM